MSEWTLQRRRSELGLPIGQSLPQLSDEELDEVVIKCITGMKQDSCIMVMINE